MQLFTTAHWTVVSILLYTIGKKAHSGATFKYCSNRPIFGMESYIRIWNRGSLVERNISNFLVFGPVYYTCL